MRQILKKLNGLLATLGGLLMTIMMVLFIVNIVSREIDKPVPALLQFAVFSMLILIYLGLANAEEDDEHVRLEVITERVSQKTKDKMNFVRYCIELVVVAIGIYAAGIGAYDSYLSGEALKTAWVPMVLWPVRFIIFVGLILYGLQLLSNIIYHKKDKNDTKSETEEFLDSAPY